MQMFTLSLFQLWLAFPVKSWFAPVFECPVNHTEWPQQDYGKLESCVPWVYSNEKHALVSCTPDSMWKLESCVQWVYSNEKHALVSCTPDYMWKLESCVQWVYSNEKHALVSCTPESMFSAWENVDVRVELNTLSLSSANTKYYLELHIHKCYSWFTSNNHIINESLQRFYTYTVILIGL